MRNFRNGQVLFSGRGGKGDRSLNIVGFEARKIGEDLLDGIAVSQTSEDGAQGNTGTLEYRFSAANFLVPDNTLFFGSQLAACAHVVASVVVKHLITAIP